MAPKTAQGLRAFNPCLVTNHVLPVPFPVNMRQIIFRDSRKSR